MTCGRVSPLSTQSTFEDLAVDFEGTTASGAERFYRRTLDKLRLKLLESGVIHTVTLKQTECRKRNKKIAAAVYQYQADNDGNPVHTGIAGSETAEICGRAVLESPGIIIHEA